MKPPLFVPIYIKAPNIPVNSSVPVVPNHMEISLDLDVDVSISKLCIHVRREIPTRTPETFVNGLTMNLGDRVFDVGFVHRMDRHEMTLVDPIILSKGSTIRFDNASQFHLWIDVTLDGVVWRQP